MNEKYTGYYRKIDDLGRVVIPKEIRKILGIKEGDSFGIFITENGVLFKKKDKKDGEDCYE